MVEWWNGGIVEWWNGGMVEWWTNDPVTAPVYKVRMRNCHTTTFKSSVNIKKDQALFLDNYYDNIRNYLHKIAECKLWDNVLDHPWTS